MEISNATQRSLTYLRNAAQILPTENRVHRLLKSHILLRSHKMLSAALGPPTTKRNASVDVTQCSKCLSTFTDQRCIIKPSTNRLISVKKLVERYDTKQPLNRSQKILAKKYRKQIYPIAQMTCMVCGNIKSTAMRTQGNKIVVNESNATSSPTTNQPKSSAYVDLTGVELVRQKNRKRDLHAGLKLPVTNTDGRPSPSCSSTAESVTFTNIVRPIVDRKLTVNAMATAPKKLNKNKAKSSQQKQGKKNKNAPPKRSSGAKDGGASKQRNNILLLANVLKMKQQHTATSNLQSMLK